MIRTSPLIWLALILILLLPTAGGRFFLDLAGGLLLLALTLPIILAGVGFLGWRYLKSRMVTCPICGTSVLTDSMNCPACGSNITIGGKAQSEVSQENNSIPASSATIDITAKDAD